MNLLGGICRRRRLAVAPQAPDRAAARAALNIAVRPYCPTPSPRYRLAAPTRVAVGRFNCHLGDRLGLVGSAFHPPLSPTRGLGCARVPESSTPPPARCRVPARFGAGTSPGRPVRPPRVRADARGLWARRRPVPASATRAGLHGALRCDPRLRDAARLVLVRLCIPLEKSRREVLHRGHVPSDQELPTRFSSDEHLLLLPSPSQSRCPSDDRGLSSLSQPVPVSEEDALIVSAAWLQTSHQRGGHARLFRCQHIRPGKHQCKVNGRAKEWRCVRAQVAARVAHPSTGSSRPLFPIRPTVSEPKPIESIRFSQQLGSASRNERVHWRLAHPCAKHVRMT